MRIIYILLSIKTRIETICTFTPNISNRPFISYYPLKQGLKPTARVRSPLLNAKIYILLSIKTRIETWVIDFHALVTAFIYILLSIKTRIETTISDFDGKGERYYLYPTIH